MIITLAPSICLSADEVEIDQLSLDELLGNIVESASKKKERLAATPSNVYVITQDMIEDYGCQDIGDALGMVPGIYITNDYSLSQIGVRGVSDYADWNSHVLVLVDGRPINEQYGGTNSIDATGLDIDNIQRIEVIKGPSSSLYGSNAFYGMVNLISKKPAENSIVVSSRHNSRLNSTTISTSLSKRLSPDALFSLDGSMTDQNGSKLYFQSFSDLSDISLMTQDEDGYNQYYLDSSSFTGGYSDRKNTINKYALRSNFKYRNFYASFHYSNMHTGIAQSMWGSLFNSSKNKFKERRMGADIGFDHSFSENFDLKSRVGYFHYTWSDDVHYNYNVWETDPAYLPGPIWKDWELDESYFAESQAMISVTPFYELVFGGEVQIHRVRQESGETEATGEIILENVIPEESIENNGRIYNLYVQNEFTVSPRLKVVGGLHLNHYTYTTGKTMPKGAVVFNPYKGGTYKLIFARGFRSPTFYELTFTDGEFYAANPNLKPELMTNYEFCNSHSLQHGFSVDLSVSYNRVLNQIAQAVVDESDPQHPGGDFLSEVLQFQNIGERDIWSAELAFRRNSVYRLSGFASFTYQKVEQKDEVTSSVRQFNSPEWLATAGLTYRFSSDKSLISGKVSFIDRRYAWDETLLPVTWTVDGSFRTNNLFMGIDLTIGIKNILNRENQIPLAVDYAPSTTIQGPGRAVYLQLGSSVGI